MFPAYYEKIDKYDYKYGNMTFIANNAEASLELGYLLFNIEIAMPASLCKIRKSFLPAMFGLIFILPQALACCGPKNSLKTELEQASFVFSGKVVKADPSYWPELHREYLALFFPAP